MKTIKDLTVKMTFRAGLGDMKVSDSVFNELNNTALNKDDMLQCHV